MKTNLPKAADGLPVGVTDAAVLDAFRPAYQQQCCVCGQSPVVKGVKNEQIVYDGEMCGPCTWGEAKTIDPAEWN